VIVSTLTSFSPAPLEELRRIAHAELGPGSDDLLACHPGSSAEGF
jgi:hypothetical protein